MKELNNYIIEKLKISSKSKIEDPRDLAKVSTVNIASEFYFNSPREENSHWMKMEQYKNKGSKPERLAKSIKNKQKLVVRWKIAIELGWLECAKIFRQAIIDRGYYTEDEVDAFAFKQYENNKYLPTRLWRYYEDYFDEYDIKYTRKQV